jgi:hypothetical protein
MRPIDEPCCLSPEERLTEIAAILATGILRLHAQAALSSAESHLEISRDSGHERLDLPAETVLSVHSG